VKPHCVNECTEILSLAFGLSTNQALSTNSIRIDFGRDLPDDCLFVGEDLLDRCVADWERKAQLEEKQREKEDRAEEPYEKKAAKYLDAAGFRHTEPDLWKLREKRVKPEDAVEALSQARSPKEMRQ
jgi:hypothetical protein